MYTPHPAFVDPENDKLCLWRYMDFEKFILLLSSSSLYFSRADYFQIEDPFEGSFPKKEYEHQIKQTSETASRNMYKIGSTNSFVNCWHLSEYESLAMWKLYSKDEKGIAIKTNLQNFKDSFHKCERNIFAGKIDYIDYETECFYGSSSHNYTSMNLFSLFIHKRKIYSYEKEFRAICSDSNGNNLKGLSIEVDLNNLIQEIYLSPYSDENQLSNVQNKIKELNLNYEVKFSSFKSKPYY